MNKNKKDFYVICHNIRSLYNVGSIFRTADALGVSKIFLSGYSGTPLNPKLSKTALGAEKIMPWEYNFSIWKLINKLKKDKINIIALETCGKTKLQNFKPKFPLALILGNEIKGLSKNILKKCKSVVSIPMFGKKESLNVAVAFGIAGYEILKYRNFKKLKK